MKEEVGKELDTVALLTDSVAELTAAVQMQNNVILVLLHNLELKYPDWKSQADIEKEVGPKIQKCFELMRSIYGPDKTNKS